MAIRQVIHDDPYCQGVEHCHGQQKRGYPGIPFWGESINALF